MLFKTSGVSFFPGIDFPQGAPTKPDLGNPSENMSLCDRSRSTSAAAVRCWWLRGPRAARGLSDTYHTSKPERRGDASLACRGHRLKGDIFGRISSWVVLFAVQDLRRAIFSRYRFSRGAPTKPELGNPTENMSLCDRSRSTSAAAVRCWWLRGPRAARGLSDLSHSSKLGRRCDASVACRGCRLHSHIFGRISSGVVLFAIQDLRRAIFSRYRFIRGAPTKPNLGNPSENVSLCVRSRSTSAAAVHCWWPHGPRAARGLSDPSYSSKLGRRCDASVACRGCRLHTHIFGRISSGVVLFAIQDLRRAIFSR